MDQAEAFTKIGMSSVAIGMYLLGRCLQGFIENFTDKRLKFFSNRILLAILLMEFYIILATVLVYKMRGQLLPEHYVLGQIMFQSFIAGMLVTVFLVNFRDKHPQGIAAYLLDRIDRKLQTLDKTTL